MLFYKKVAVPKVLSIYVMALAGAAMVHPGVVHAQKETATLSAQQRSAMEAVIRDYLLKNPAIIRDAMMALQAKDALQREASTRQALQKHRIELLNDVDSPVGGNPHGDITVVEFFDYNCGYCKKASGGLKELAARDPNVRIVYKEFPILSQESTTAAKAALAARRHGKYEEFHYGLMAAEKTDDAAIQTLATKLGLDYSSLNKDMADQKWDAQLARNHQLANALGISGTPAFIIGDSLIPGAVDAEKLISLVNAERARLSSAQHRKTRQTK